MANVIRIKRRASGSAGAPASLLDSELAYNQVDDTIYIGKGTGGAGGTATTIEAIAGKGAFLALAGAQVVTGDKEFSGAIDFTGTIEIDGTAITATAAELNKLAGVTPGTASAGKALVVDANKDLDIDGLVTVSELVITGDLTVQGTTTSISSTELVISDKNITLADGSASDAASNGAGITIKGTSDHTLTYSNSGSSFVSSESLDVASGKVFKVNGTEVLSATALGSGVVSSSLESVGVISAGTWEGDAVDIAYGGTGEVTAQAAINALSQVSGASVGQVLTKVGSDAVWATPTDTGITSLNGLTGTTQTFATGTGGTDFAITSSAGTHTFDLPDASLTARGLVTTGAQSFKGSKTVQSDSAGSSALIVKGAAGQSADFLQIQDSTGYKWASVTTGGTLYCSTVQVWDNGGGIDKSTSNGNLQLKYAYGYGVTLASSAGPSFQIYSQNSAHSFDSSSDPFQFVINGSAKLKIDSDGKLGVNESSAGGQAQITVGAANRKGFIVKGAASQSANLIEAQDSSGTAVFTVSSAGAITGSWSGDVISVAKGGTGASTVLGAQQALDLEPGVDVQEYSARLQAIADLSGSFSAGVIQLVGYSAGSTAEYVESSAFGRSLLDDADASAARATLGLTIGTNVQAYDAELDALASVTSAANKLPYFTGSGTASVTDFSSFGRSLVDDADASGARSTLGLVIGTDVQAYDSELAALASVVSAADKLPYFTGSGTADVTTLSSFGRSLIDDADASASRTTLGLGTIATQAASNVAITGGTIDGVTFDGGSF